MKRAVSGKKAQEPEDYDDFRELEAALRIDEYALEEALREQPGLFYRVGAAYAMEVSRRDAAKQALQDQEARESLDVREGARESGEKITEGQVSATVQTAPDVVRARERLLELSESVGRLGALKEAFQQRSYALKDLAGLYVANYYSASENSGASGEIRRRDADGARRAMSAARRSAS